MNFNRTVTALLRRDFSSQGPSTHVDGSEPSVSIFAQCSTNRLPTGPRHCWAWHSKRLQGVPRSAVNFTTPLPELTFEKLRRLAWAVASFSHQSIDERRPILSATLPGDERMQIVIPPATLKGTVSLTIRKPLSSRGRTYSSRQNGGCIRSFHTKRVLSGPQFLSVH